MMSFVSTPLLRVVTTALVLVTFLSPEQRMVFAEQATNTNINEKMDALTLVNKPIESLAALSSGVYSLVLAEGVRPGCGGGKSSPGDQGMYERLFDFIRIVVFTIYMYLL
jgi:hypothetical protein